MNLPEDKPFIYEPLHQDFMGPSPPSTKVRIFNIRYLTMRYFSKGDFPKWQAPNFAISQAATSQICPREGFFYTQDFDLQKMKNI